LEEASHCAAAINARGNADDALLIARTVRDGDFIPFQPGNEDTEQPSLCVVSGVLSAIELTNPKRRLTGLIDLSSVGILTMITAKRPHAVNQGCSKRGRYRPAVFAPTRKPADRRQPRSTRRSESQAL
jgi:hypothetical protein